MELIEVINQVVQNNIEANKPTDLVVGTVKTVAPLSIEINANMAPIPAANLVLTDAVKERQEDVTISDSFRSTLSGYNINVAADAVIGTVTVQHGLEVGDSVILIRALKGQAFIVLSKA